MTRSLRIQRKSKQSHRNAKTGLEVELLDRREMMSASPPSATAAAPTAQAIAAVEVGEELGQAALAEGIQDEVTIGPAGDGTLMPNPEDDDGDLGPIGPWVREGLQALTENLAERFVQETQMMAMQGGSMGQPSPDDDGPWPPGIGPVIKTANQLYMVVAHDFLKEAGGNAWEQTSREGAAYLQRAILGQLTQLAEPDPEPWVDWRGIMETAADVGGADAGYPAPDDDGDPGPAGPWVHEGLPQLAINFADQLGEDMRWMAMQGGSTGQPSPDDDTPWPPGIGPLIKTVDDLFAVVAVDTLRNLAEANPDPTPWTPDGVKAHIELQLFLWLHDPDPNVLIDWNGLMTGQEESSQITMLHRRLPGDVNNDGIFDSNDLIEILSAGKYEDGIPDNATFEEGDFNYDNDFDSDDLIYVLALGHYEVDLQDMEADGSEPDPIDLIRHLAPLE